MNELKIFDNAEFGKVRVVMIDGEPWFVGKDVAEALAYKDRYSAMRKNVGEDDKRLCPVGSTSGIQNTLVINESGLYSLIFGSKLDSAKRFKHWVTSEVLPSIRRAGAYISEQEEMVPLNPAVASGVADLGRITERIMKNQGSAPHKIAEVFKFECEQFGLRLPVDFVKIPPYEQMRLPIEN